MNISFYKESDRWYADIPSVSKEDCEMVQGADLLLDRLSLGYDKVDVDFSDVDNGKPIYRYHLMEHDENGGTFYDPGMSPLTGVIHLNDTISLNDSDPRTFKCVSTNNDVNTNTNITLNY